MLFAVGSVLLSFLWVLKTLSALGAFSGGLEKTYFEHYYTWIQVRPARHQLSISRSTGSPPFGC